MKLQSRPRLAHDRCVEPADTIARLEAILRPRHDYWLHHEEVGPHLHWTAMLIDEFDFRSMGKGVTAAGSHAGALAEGAEWLSAREVGDLPGYLGARERDVSDAVPLTELLPHIATATPPVLDRIRRLDDAFHWVEAHSLLTGRTRRVPLEYVRLIGGPNGRATGNVLEEALLHATLEIFERRAHVTVLRQRLVLPTIDLATVTHPILRAQIDFLHGQGIEITLKDFSFGDALPCVGGYFVDPAIPAEYQFRHFLKVGASFDAEEALLRIFTEYTQGRRRDEFIDPAGDREAQLAVLLETDFRALPSQDNDCDNFLSAFMFGLVPYRDAGFLRQGEVVPFKPRQPEVDLLDDLERAREICTALGKDYLAVDLTDPAVGFPVVQVIVPGYSDVLPFQPASSHGLFRRWTRAEVLASYQPSPAIR